MTAVIIGAGDFPRKAYPRYLIGTADIVICCDSALKAYLAAMPSIFGKERLPDAVVGDMDSLPRALQKKYSDILVKVTEQEHNDQTKAFTHLMSLGLPLDTVHFIGITGKRADHTIGNLSLLMEYGKRFDLEGISIDAVSDYETVIPVWDSVSLMVGKGRKVSILSPDNSLKISCEGLMYNTSGVVFDNWWKATLNIATEDEIKLNFSHHSSALICLN